MVNVWHLVRNPNSDYPRADSKDDIPNDRCVAMMPASSGSNIFQLATISTWERSRRISCNHYLFSLSGNNLCSGNTITDTIRSEHTRVKAPRSAGWTMALIQGAGPSHLLLNLNSNPNNQRSSKKPNYIFRLLVLLMALTATGCKKLLEGKRTGALQALMDSIKPRCWCQLPH